MCHSSLLLFFHRLAIGYVQIHDNKKRIQTKLEGNCWEILSFYFPKIFCIRHETPSGRGDYDHCRVPVTWQSYLLQKGKTTQNKNQKIEEKFKSINMVKQRQFCGFVGMLSPNISSFHLMLSLWSFMGFWPLFCLN